MKTTISKLLAMAFMVSMIGFSAGCAKDYDDDIRKVEQQANQNNQLIRQELAEQIQLARDYAAALDAALKSDLEGQISAAQQAAIQAALNALQNFIDNDFAALSDQVTGIGGDIEQLKSDSEKFLAFLTAFLGDNDVEITLPEITAQLGVIGDFISDVDPENNTLGELLKKAQEDAEATAAAAWTAYLNGATSTGTLYGDLVANLPATLQDIFASYETDPADALSLEDAYKEIKTIAALNEFKDKFKDEYFEMLELLLDKYGADLGVLTGLTDDLLEYAASNGTTISYQQVADWVADAKTQYNQIAEFFKGKIQGVDIDDMSAAEVIALAYDYVVGVYEELAAKVDALGTGDDVYEKILEEISEGDTYTTILDAVKGKIDDYVAGNDELQAAIALASGWDAWLGTGANYTTLKDYVVAIFNVLYPAASVVTQDDLAAMQTLLQDQIDEMKDPAIVGSLAYEIEQLKARLEALEKEIKGISFVSQYIGYENQIPIRIEVTTPGDRLTILDPIVFTFEVSGPNATEIAAKIADPADTDYTLTLSYNQLIQVRSLVNLTGTVENLAANGAEVSFQIASLFTQDQLAEINDGISNYQVAAKVSWGSAGASVSTGYITIVSLSSSPAPVPAFPDHDWMILKNNALLSDLYTLEDDYPDPATRTQAEAQSDFQSTFNMNTRPDLKYVDLRSYTASGAWPSSGTAEATELANLTTGYDNGSGSYITDLPAPYQASLLKVVVEPIPYTHRFRNNQFIPETFANLEALDNGNLRPANAAYDYSAANVWYMGQVIKLTVMYDTNVLDTKYLVAIPRWRNTTP